MRDVKVNAKVSSRKRERQESAGAGKSGTRGTSGTSKTLELLESADTRRCRVVDLVYDIRRDIESIPKKSASPFHKSDREILMSDVKELEMDLERLEEDIKSMKDSEERRVRHSGRDSPQENGGEVMNEAEELTKIGNEIGKRGGLAAFAYSPKFGRARLAVTVEKSARREGEKLERAVERIVDDKRLMGRLEVIGIDGVKSAVEYRLRG